VCCTGFFAPEVLLQSVFCVIKAEVFSLGCIALEMLLTHTHFNDCKRMTAYIHIYTYTYIHIYTCIYVYDGYCYVTRLFTVSCMPVCLLELMRAVWMSTFSMLKTAHAADFNRKIRLAIIAAQTEIQRAQPRYAVVVSFVSVLTGYETRK
jgi:hypothetical protein